MPAKRPSLTPAEARAELDRRALAAGVSFTAETFAGGHGPQLQYLLCTALYVVVLCSRRAGKTMANLFLLAITAMRTSNVTCLYLGLTDDQVRSTAWRLWKPMLKKYKLPATSTEDMVTTFANGSVVHFGSLSTERVAMSWLGNSLAGGIAILDEIQEAATDLLESAERIIEPALTDTTPEHPVPGRLIYSGTWPETATGKLYKLYTDKTNNEQYAKFSWNRFQNPFLINQQAHLEAKLKRLKVTVDEPFIQREEFGRPVYDKDATAYGFIPAKNLYTAPPPLWFRELDLKPFDLLAMQPPELVTNHVIGIDPAGRADRYAIEVISWGTDSDRLWHTFEAITERAANPLQSQADAVLVALHKVLREILGIVRDYGSAAVLDDSLAIEHGIANIEPAVKIALKSRVDRVRDLNGTGRLMTMAGSALAEDFAKARWDAKAREQGRWVWHASHHPDGGDAINYAIGKYVTLYVPRVTPETLVQQMERLAREAWQQPRDTHHGPPVDQFAQAQPAVEGYGGNYGGEFNKPQ